MHFSTDTLHQIKNSEILVGIRDSKILTLAKRDKFAEEIKKFALYWKVVFVSHKYIDAFNINRAIFYGINRAIPFSSQIDNPFLFVDGNYKIQLSKSVAGYLSLPKGDDIVPSISAASILAKTYRDQYMEKMDLKYPGYGFSRHKGYGTEYHRNQLVNLGISPIHRLSFLKFLRKGNEEKLFDHGESI